MEEIGHEAFAAMPPEERLLMVIFDEKQHDWEHCEDCLRQEKEWKT